MGKRRRGKGGEEEENEEDEEDEDEDEEKRARWMQEQDEYKVPGKFWLSVSIHPKRKLSKPYGAPSR